MYIGQLRGKRLNVDWRQIGSDRFVDTPNQDLTVEDLPLAVIRGTMGSVRIANGAEPIQFAATLFSEIGTSGIPIGEGIEVDCLYSSECQIDAAGPGEVSARLNLSKEHKVVIFHLSYFLSDPGKSEPDVETNYASYGFRLDVSGS